MSHSCSHYCLYRLSHHPWSPTDWPMTMQQWPHLTNQRRGPGQWETSYHLVSGERLREVTGDSKAIYHHIMITAISENIFALLLIRAQGKHHLHCARGLRSVRARNYLISQIDFNADKSPHLLKFHSRSILGRNSIGGIWGKDAGRGLDNGSQCGFS